MGRRAPSSMIPLMMLLALVLVLAHATCSTAAIGHGNTVFRVQRKFPGKIGDSFAAATEHDRKRPRTLLEYSDSYDIPINGIGGTILSLGIYYAEVVINNVTYQVQIDTGSDILWLNCEGCTRCPKKTTIGGIELHRYDSSGKILSCADSDCYQDFGDTEKRCKQNPKQCKYTTVYGDGSSSSGHFAKDNVTFKQVIGNSLTADVEVPLVFGCGTEQSGGLEVDGQALDGIWGFGQGNASIISQLHKAGKTKNVFAHCLDNKKDGGGIFVIGNVAEDKLVSTPLSPDRTRFDLGEIELSINGKKLVLPKYSHASRKGSIVDSGTSLAFMPGDVVNATLSKVFEGVDKKDLLDMQGYHCFKHKPNSSMDGIFPSITFHFKEASLVVTPHQYMISVGDDASCFGFLDGDSLGEGYENFFVLGELFLANRIFVYDLEKREFGWSEEYDCQSMIKVKHATTNNVFDVASRDSNSTTSTATVEFQMGKGALSAVLSVIFLSFLF